MTMATSTPGYIPSIFSILITHNTATPSLALLWVMTWAKFYLSETLLDSCLNFFWEEKLSINSLASAIGCS